MKGALKIKHLAHVVRATESQLVISFRLPWLANNVPSTNLPLPPCLSPTFPTLVFDYPICLFIRNVPVLSPKPVTSFTVPTSGLHVAASRSIHLHIGFFCPDHPPNRYGISPHRFLSLLLLSSLVFHSSFLQTSRTYSRLLSVRIHQTTWVLRPFPWR